MAAVLSMRPMSLLHKRCGTGRTSVGYGSSLLVSRSFSPATGFPALEGGSWVWQLLLGITTLCTGYGLAGLARRFLVWPAAMIWPANLVNATLFYALHDHSPSDPRRTNGWSIGRYKWFLVVFVGSFVWYWFP